MINREIIYERNLTGSYMKIPVAINAGLDEKLMLRRKIAGTLPVEKAYVDGGGQYWYNITGRQSLDVYCRVKEIGISFVERLIISICSEMEIMEWNLIDTRCLMLDPELIFITNSNQEIIFTIYPGGTGSVEKEFQQLMEFLLTRIDHKDSCAVRAVYGIYEKSLEEGYSIPDIREKIIESKNQRTADVELNSWVSEQTAGETRKQESVRRIDEVPMYQYTEGTTKERTPENIGCLTDRRQRKGKNQDSDRKMTAKKKRWIEVIKRKMVDFGIIEPESKSESQIVPVYPEEELCIRTEPVIRPTVCLSSYTAKARGILLYQGTDQLEDIPIEGKMVRIGYGRDADIQINRDTISQLHARIDHEDESYYIEDLNSTNGTFVNDELLDYRERRKLTCNDVVRFADIRYRFT